MRQDPFSLTYDVTPVSSLAPADLDALWNVYRRHFDADREQLDGSLSRSDYVVRYRRRKTGELCGLVGYSLRPAEHEGRTFFWLWSGALAMDRDCRGKLLIERSGLEVMARFRMKHPTAPLFWIYESNSFQSYRMMARNFDVFWPHPSRPTPSWEHGLADKLARSHFGARWDSEQRVLRPTGRKRIRGTSSLTTTDSREPMRAFYQSLNPNAEDGAAVVLIAALDWHNAAILVKRSIERLVRS